MVLKDESDSRLLALPPEKGREIVAEIVRALMCPEVEHHLAPPFRNGEVTVTVRVVNGRVAYVQPVIKPELKMGVDFGRKAS